jgi:hypothetical protein
MYSGSLARRRGGHDSLAPHLIKTLVCIKLSCDIALNEYYILHYPKSDVAVAHHHVPMVGF